MKQEFIDELKREDLSVLAVREDFRYTSRGKGISPVLLPLREDRYFFRDCCIVDKCIGRAAALLFIYSGVKEVHALLMSKSAIEVLEQYHIPYQYETYTEKVLNNAGNDLCPMEKTVLEIDDPEEAYFSLDKKLRSLV